MKDLTKIAWFQNIYLFTQLKARTTMDHAGVGVVDHAGLGWVMQGAVGHTGVGLGGSCRGWVGHTWVAVGCGKFH